MVFSVSRCLVGAVIGSAYAVVLLAGCGSGTNGGGGSTPAPPIPPTPTTNGEWAWIAGSSTLQLMANGFYGQSGKYGTLGIPSADNNPAGRVGAVTWTDGNSNLWLYSGNGYDSTGTLGTLNDLWEFDPSAKTWTWVSGSNIGTPNGSADGTPGIYGTLGIPSAMNSPSGRSGSASWTDSTGNLWLFGGYGFDSTGAPGYLNDLWKFNPSNAEWTWVSGSNTANAPGVFGTQGTPAAANVPPARGLAISWTDSSGNLWLFGGAVAPNDASGNDLWEFNPTTAMWTWVSGSDTAASNAGVYGTLGVSSANNIPGKRYDAVSWIDSSDNLWLFGGQGNDSTGTVGVLNDLWQFSLKTKQWTWMSGSNIVPVAVGGQAGVYGTLGVAAASNVPGSRTNPVSWTDSSGNLWLFGGQGLGSTNAGGWLNDLWEFSPTIKTWTWMGGSDTTYANATQFQPDQGQPGVYGAEGIPAAANAPGGRYYAVRWTDRSGNFWLFGGEGHDATAAQIGALNDLWRYHP